MVLEKVMRNKWVKVMSPGSAVDHYDNLGVSGLMFNMAAMRWESGILISCRGSAQALRKIFWPTFP